MQDDVYLIAAAGWMQAAQPRSVITEFFNGFVLHHARFYPLIGKKRHRTKKKPDFEPGIGFPCFAGVNTSCGKIGAETQLTNSCISLSDVILGGDILVIRVPEEILNGTFLAYTIRASHNRVMQLVSGTTGFHLYARDMANFRFIVPSVREQNAIVSILSDMDAEIEALERRRDKVRAIKQGIMQEMLTGRVRLVTSESFAQERQIL